MGEFLINFSEGVLEIFQDAAVFVLFGFIVAGLLHVFIPTGRMRRFLGAGRFGPVIKASIMGLPLPLCSCGVLPAAIGLRRQGASKGATISFLISTPETGVDSIAISYALLDPIMAIFRPVAAFITALVLLLAGPATNSAGIIVVARELGKKVVAVYLLSIAAVSIIMGIVLDVIYDHIVRTPAKALIGTASEALPGWLRIGGAVVLAGLLVRALAGKLLARRSGGEGSREH